VLSNVQHLSRFDLENREVSDGNRVKTRRDERSHVLPQRIEESGLTGKPIETLIDHIEFDEGRDPVSARAWEKI
jgi:hypothetical protein